MREPTNLDAGEPFADAPARQGAPESASQGASDDQLYGMDPMALLELTTAERDRLAAEKAELQETLLRRQADFENFRRRVERERQETFDYANMESVKSLLPVLDDFRRALRHAPADEGPMRDYATGMELIFQRLMDTLAKLGLEPLEAAGQPFDPEIHHAVQREEREDCEDHTVLEEYQKGYNFRGRLLRPAMVKVAVKP